MHSAICLTVPCMLYSQSTGMGKYHGNKGFLNKWMRYGAEKNTFVYLNFLDLIGILSPQDWYMRDYH
jgi:hypothetical protein